MATEILTIEDLDNVVRTRPCRGKVGRRFYSDLGNRFPKMRGEIRRWFEDALADEERKWVAAALLAVRPEATQSLIIPLLSAAIREPNPSFNRAMIQPLRGTLAYDEASEKLVALATTDEERGGVARADYWARIDLGPGSPEAIRRMSRWCARSFLKVQDVYARRCLLGPISFTATPGDDDEARDLADVIRIASSSEDDYLRSRLSVQLGQSRLYPALVRPKDR
jgi:hypothetical protein